MILGGSKSLAALTLSDTCTGTHSTWNVNLIILIMCSSFTKIKIGSYFYLGYYYLLYIYIIDYKCCSISITLT